MTRKEAVEQARRLVDRMTVQEAASQLRYDAPAITRLGVPSYNWWNESLHGVARAGRATMFPQAIGLGATFDPELLQQIGEAIAVEGRAKYQEAQKHEDHDIYKGLTFWAPNVNIFRDPRWGRGHETYGEDPVLTARLGVAYIKGIQKKTSDGYMMAAACAKHFAVHSGPENERHTFDAQVSDRDLWETYLPAFEACVREGKVEAVMGAYNRTNGEPCCGHEYLIGEVLRRQWGFEGHFVSDCWAIQDFHMHHHVTAFPEDSVKKALEAGCDLNCGCTYQKVMNAYERGLIKEETIREAAVRLMTTRYLLGILGEGSHEQFSMDEVESPEHLRLSRQAAVESIVLLKNQGRILPIDRDRVRTVGVIGPNADSVAALRGNYYGEAGRYVTVLEGIREEASRETMPGDEDQVRVLYAKGCPLWEGQDPQQGTQDALDDMLLEAHRVARDSDLLILCLGLDETLEGEEGDEGNAFASGDKKDLSLPACQQRLLEEMIDTGRPVVLCMLAGSAMDMTYASEHAGAILQVWYPGSEGGHALADILFGRQVPGGKLPVTIYRDINDLPDFRDYSMKGRTYRYLLKPALYPFGFGLGYGAATITGVQVFGNINDGEVLQVQADIHNDSEYPVNEVLQLYAHCRNSSDETPKPHLLAFCRIRLAPGGACRHVFGVNYRDFATVNILGRRHVSGTIGDLYLGFGQPDRRSLELADISLRMVKVPLMPE